MTYAEQIAAMVADAPDLTADQADRLARAFGLTATRTAA